MANTAAGWLILNTDNTDTASYELHIGKNRIGRVSRQSRPDIPITGDEYVSRNHAILVVRISNRNVYEYLIVDNEKLLGKPSTNGTYVNGASKRIGDQPVMLKDGDTIQCGNTKFTLKTTDISVTVDDGVKLQQRIGEEVVQQKMAPGVVLRRKV